MNERQDGLSRRDVLKLAGSGVLGAALLACRSPMIGSSSCRRCLMPKMRWNPISTRARWASITANIMLATPAS